LCRPGLVVSSPDRPAKVKLLYTIVRCEKMKMKNIRCGQTVIELICMLLLFSAGFLVGHFVANKTGEILFGILAGFVTCWGIAFLYSITIGKMMTKRELTVKTGNSKKETPNKISEATPKPGAPQD
jgi:hypothetical protein